MAPVAEQAYRKGLASVLVCKPAQVLVSACRKGLALVWAYKLVQDGEPVCKREPAWMADGRSGRVSAA